MKRVVVEDFGGPEVLKLIESEEPRPGAGEVLVRVLAAGVSFTDALIRAGTYLGVPKPPLTPGYELVGIVEELGPGCSKLKVGDHVAALTVWGAYAEKVCLREDDIVAVPDDLDPAQVVSLVLTYVTAYQLLHRMAKVQPGETLLIHGAAGRVGTAVLELGAMEGLRMYGTASARNFAAVERLGAEPIDYRNEDFLARVRSLPDRGVDVVLDGLGGALSLRSFRALRKGGRLVVFGHHSTMADGHKSWRGWAEWYSTTAAVALWGFASPGKHVMAYRIQKLYGRKQWFPLAVGGPARLVGGCPRVREWFQEDFTALLELLRADKIHPVVAQQLPLGAADRAHELLEQTAATGKLVLVP